MAKTKIEWADRVWNPVTGCTKVSEGCRHCYAERMAKRLAGRFGYPEKPDQFKVTLHPDKLYEPMEWKAPQRIFPCSMSDMFHPDVPVSFIDKMFQVMADTPRHIYMVLTKRPERMRLYFRYVEQIKQGVWALPSRTVGILNRWPLPNVWVGTSVEDQKSAEERIPMLLKIPAAVKFVSCEPLLGPVDLKPAELHQWPDMSAWMPNKEEPDDWKYWMHRWNGIQWVIAGGESGPGARPMHPDWARSLRDQCQAAGVPFLFKQWGEWIPDSQVWKDPGVPWETTNQAAEDVIHNRDLWAGRDIYQFDDKNSTYRVGKKAAGRLLDGVLWDEYPEEPTPSPSLKGGENA